MDPWKENQLLMTRRHFFGLNAAGIGTAALASVLGQNLGAAGTSFERPYPGLPGVPHFAPKAKRVI